MRTSSDTRPRQVLRQDALVALGVAALMVLGSAVIVADDLWSALPSVSRRLELAPAQGALLLAGSLPLVFRRVAPLPVFALCVVASLGLQVLRDPTPLPLGVLVAVCSVAVRHRPLVSIGAAGTYLALLAAGIATGIAPISDDLFYDYLISLIATVMLGYGLALGRIRARLAERRSAELVREQEEATRAAVAQEQARIAREVHDIVAHDVSVIVAQAAAARHVSGDRPQVASDALSSIETVGRDALDGLRRLLTLLRTDAGDGDRSPQPTLEGLPRLLAQVERVGLPVRLTIRGRPRPLPATVELNAYRIVQESLTNILKHAGPTPATVLLDYRGADLRVEVRDEGRGATGSPASGYGLVGMHARASTLGGELVAGPVEHGYRVSARLPVAEASR